MNADNAAEAAGVPGAAPIRLSPTSYLVLGMVRLGVSSGYAIKKVADMSTQNFWPTSLALIYPELKRLEKGALLDRRSDPQGGRARSAYKITPAGEAALEGWLKAEKAMSVQIRDEAMLKLFLADALAEPADRLDLVHRLRERNREKKANLRENIIPQAEAAEAAGIRFIPVTARLSADLFEAAEEWLADFEQKLDREQADATVAALTAGPGKRAADQP